MCAEEEREKERRKREIVIFFLFFSVANTTLKRDSNSSISQYGEFSFYSCTLLLDNFCGNGKMRGP